MAVETARSIAPMIAAIRVDSPVGGLFRSVVATRRARAQRTTPIARSTVCPDAGKDQDLDGVSGGAARHDVFLTKTECQNLHRYKTLHHSVITIGRRARAQMTTEQAAAMKQRIPANKNARMYCLVASNITPPTTGPRMPATP